MEKSTCCYSVHFKPQSMDIVARGKNPSVVKVMCFIFFFFFFFPFRITQANANKKMVSKSVVIV